MTVDIHPGPILLGSVPQIPLLASSIQLKQNLSRKGKRPIEEEFEAMEPIEDDSDKDMPTAEADGSIDPTTGKPKKRRRSRKGLDKKYVCEHADCGKSYSRAEHLYRHNLNHAPKAIYNCEFPDCTRSFVRQDLCARHHERHTNKGSQLQRKDAFQNGQNIKIDRKNSIGKSSSPDNSTTAKNTTAPTPTTIRSNSFNSVYTPTNITTTPTMLQSITPAPKDVENRPKVRRNASSAGETNVKIKMEQRPSGSNGIPSNSRRRKPSLDIPDKKVGISPSESSHQYDSFNPILHNGQPMQHYPKPPIIETTATPSLMGLSINSPFATQSPISMIQYNQIHQQQIRQAQEMVTNGPPATFSVPMGAMSAMNTHYTAHGGLPPFTLPPQVYPSMSQTQQSATMFGVTSPPISATSNGPHVNATVPVGVLDTSAMESMQTLVPVFGGDNTYKRSPHTLTDDFAAWLFGDANYTFSQAQTASFMERSSMGLYLDQDMANHPFFPGPNFHHPMSVTSIIAPPSPPQESHLSEHKRQELVDMIESYPDASSKFHNNLHSSMVATSIEDNGVLSLNSMQLYIQLFWQNFHPQLPILHKPTFSADKTPNLLLLSIMAIGASCVDRKQDTLLASTAAELSTLLAMNLRWHIFDHSDFRPPAKLWIFQALLILEIFEKMYATRQLHERAHIHHATTLTLMRRGSSLQGKCALDSPPSVREEKTPSGHNSAGSGGASGSTTPDEWWNHWIVSEATKRCAFTAFVIDSVHATMFGHSAVMVAHEMRLNLPCDESLWNAPSAAELNRLEQNSMSKGFKPTPFLDGLKKTLSGQSVRTNSFGRTVLMAGLLSVAWHMNQRDLQVSSLGATSTLGGRDKWRSSLTRAFDMWKVDFDASLSKMPTSATSAYDGVDYFLPSSEDFEHENVFESRTVLHHLAHMAMHVDIVDLQIYAGARRLLGRSIAGSDSRSAQRRMKEWANTARARDATFYALRFLRKVLVPAEGSQPTYVTDDEGSRSIAQRKTTYDETAPLAYCARDDFLLNRPWVLYFAMLIVWSYGFALDGPLDPSKHVMTTPADQYRDMRRYLLRMSGVKSPDDMISLVNRNYNLGLLFVLRKQFGEMRWELLLEAANLLGQCIDISTGKIQIVT